MSKLLERLRNKQWPFTFTNAAPAAAACVVPNMGQTCFINAGGTAASPSPDKDIQDAIARIETLEDTLRRLRKWDHLDGAGDGPYWKTVIDAALEESL